MIIRTNVLSNRTFN